MHEQIVFVHENCSRLNTPSPYAVSACYASLYDGKLMKEEIVSRFPARCKIDHPSNQFPSYLALAALSAP
jgi:hypothetical protein